MAIKIYIKQENIWQKGAKQAEKVVLCSGTGRWLSHLILDGQVTWKIQDDCPQMVVRQERMINGEPILPSDMEFREDIPVMITKNWQEAEVLKNKMEE